MSSKRTSLLLLGAALCISFVLDPTPDRLPFLALLAAISGTIILPRSKTERTVGVLICCALLFFYIGPTMHSRFLEDTVGRITEEPAQHWAAPDTLVRLGGQQISFQEESSRYIMTACYWLDNSKALVAAHRAKGFASGSIIPIQVIGKGQIEELSAKILANDDNGVALELTKEFLPTTDLYPIAATSEIVVGGEAEIISTYGGSFPVVVKGFLDLVGQQERVVVEKIKDTDNFVGGMSGSPIVQNGKIIGFMNGTLKGEKRLALCSIAAEVYANTADLMNECNP